jgi:hypothetical protein
MTIREIDLPEATRRNDVYNQLSEIHDRLQGIPVYPSLLWLWTFDILYDTYIVYKDVQEDNDEVIAEGITLKNIFDQFWEDVDTLGFTMDNGGEILEETILDWMRENDFLVALEEDGWLNG